MHPVESLRELGGTASWSSWTRRTSVAEARRVLRSGDVRRAAHDRYVLAEADEALQVAAALGGVLSHGDAALRHGWATRTVGGRPHVAVSRSRRLTPEQRRAAQVHHLDLTAEEVQGPVTSPTRTLVDCLRSLPADEALAIADSALREGSVSPEELRSLARDLRGRGAGQARRVARLADGLAANPFESVLRHHALQVPGLQVEPQVAIEMPELFVRPDLVDRQLRLVLEADSHAWHSSRAQLRRDCRRHTLLTSYGWLLLRFSHGDVMTDPAFVVDAITRTVVERQRQGGRRRAG